jgi:hypothetical protein
MFTDEALRDPYPLYRELRDLGAVVHLNAHGMYALRADRGCGPVGWCRCGEARPTVAMCIAAWICWAVVSN